MSRPYADREPEPPRPVLVEPAPLPPIWPLRALDALNRVGVLAVVYWLSWEAQRLALAQLAWGPGVDWLFLPAAVKLWLLLRWGPHGAVALGLGVMQVRLAHCGAPLGDCTVWQLLSPWHALEGALVAVALWSAVGLARRWRWEPEGGWWVHRPWSAPWWRLACVAATLNTLAYLALWWHRMGPLELLAAGVPMWLGDALGAVAGLCLMQAAVWAWVRLPRLFQR